MVPGDESIAKLNFQIIEFEYKLYQICSLKNMDYRSTQVLPALIATFGAFGCGTGIAWPSVVQKQIE